jgi:hypothetical protein
MHPIERLRSLARTDPERAGLAARGAVDALAGLHDDPAGLVVACRRLVDHEPALGVMWWVCAELLATSDVRDGAWRVGAALDADATPETLATELPSERTVAVVGRSDEILGGLALRSDCDGVLVDLPAHGHGEQAWSYRRRRGLDLDEVELDEVDDVLTAGDVLLVDVLAASGTGWIGPAGVDEAIARARSAGAEVWGVAPTGRVLPASLFRALCQRLEARDDARAAAALGSGHLGGSPRYRHHDLALLDVVIGSGGVWEPGELATVATCPVAPELLRF